MLDCVGKGRKLSRVIKSYQELSITERGRIMQMLGVLLEGYSVEAGVFTGTESKYRVVATFGTFTVAPPEFNSIVAMEEYFQLKFARFVKPV